MKIGILTFHCAHNYGAMLQAYASNQYLNQLGHDCKIIDYRPEYIYSLDDFNFFRQWSSYRGKGDGLIISSLKVLRDIKRYLFRTKKWHLYNNFFNNYLRLTNRVTKENLCSLPFDVVICGSDQIWNSHYTQGLQGVYFLDFVSNNTKKIAYAASNGKDIFPENEDELVKNYLQGFHKIMVREKGLADYIKREYKLTASSVCDPVFLLSNLEWASLALKPKQSKYLLIYTFDEDELIYETALQIAKEKSLKIIKISSPVRFDFKGITCDANVGPLEFLGYILHADYICTSSFHACAFSIIFNKQFLCFPHKKFGVRTENLLTNLQLTQQNVLCYEDGITKSRKEIDYKTINPLLSVYITTSQNQLIESIDE